MKTEMSSKKIPAIAGGGGGFCHDFATRRWQCVFAEFFHRGTPGIFLEGAISV